MVATFNVTLGEALNKASLFLREHNHEESLARTYWMMAFDQNLTDIVLNSNQPVKEEDYHYYMQLLKEIVQDKPIQYLLGHAYFMDKQFKVNEHTLIPREDSAGIVELATQAFEKNSAKTILDIGTGTGILAIMLALTNPTAKVTATDISKQALQVAQENAQVHGAQIDFIESDLFTNIPKQTFDIIVSNPPYISEDELDLMDASVKKYEPKLALFAQDNGLAIYKKMAEQILDYVTESCTIILEIGFKQGEQVKEIFQASFPQAQIEVRQDLNGLDRYVHIQL